MSTHQLNVCFCICWSIVLLTIHCCAQNADTAINKQQRVWIEPVNQYVTLKLTQSSEAETFAVFTKDNKIELSPNAKSKSRFGFNYRFISVSFNIIPKFIEGNDDDEEKGKTKGGGFAFGLNFSHWLQDFSYSKTRGYYLENTKDYNPAWKPGDPYIQIPDLVFQSFQGATAYSFNPRYSVKAVAFQSERQVKSAGSFIPSLFYRYYITDDRTPPTATSIHQKSKNLELVIGAGYYYTFVLKRSFYFSLGAAPGGGVVFTKFITKTASESIVSKQRNGIFRMDARLGLGYNGPRFFSGIYSSLSASSANQQHTTATNSDARLVFQIFVGYRLNAPKFLKKKVGEIEQLISDKMH